MKKNQILSVYLYYQMGDGAFWSKYLPRLSWYNLYNFSTTEHYEYQVIKYLVSPTEC